jgi:hypothetical protein
MRAFKKFNPAAYRETRLSPPPPAKPAKVAKPACHFSNFSNFSSGASPTRSSWAQADWQAYFDERAAIREYDGGLSRSEAERLAFDDAVAHWLSAHPAPVSAPDACVHCGGGDRTFDELLPVLTSGGNVWVHNKCWKNWYAVRRQKAVAALQGIGLGQPHPTCQTISKKSAGG